MLTEILEQLDYFRIRQTIAGHCMTTEGKAKLNKRLPYVDINLMNTRKQEASEWVAYLSAGRENPIIQFDAVEPLFHIISVEGAVLELEQIYNLGKFCQCVINVKKYLSNEGEKDFERRGKFKLNLPSLNSLSEKLPDLYQPEEMIFHVIDKDGALKDLPELRAIRSSIQKIRKDIESLMKSYTSNQNLKDVLQSDVPVLRGDRQVLAVKSNARGKISGIVHELSQSGQTAYIEPDDIVRKNNDLLQEEFRLQQEIRRILRELTKQLSEFKSSFEFAHRIVLKLDCALAVAKWCSETSGTFATTNENINRIVLKKARHPLLGKSAVPIDVEFLDGCKILVITGPNTGGKTVTLKTIALFALLNQSGFSVPASDGTVLPVFDNIFADIGDGQSLDQSLSTFSAHMKNIAIALKHATDKTLVLLDELGSGTDPQEGGAIAMAVLDELLKKGSYGLVTTHHGILKNYAYTHPSCVNASVEFNPDTLSPTYKILMGIPGESHALDIAVKSGLSKNIISKARDYLVSERSDVSALIRGLTEKHQELNALEEEAAKKEKYIADKWRKVDLKDLQLRQKEMELRQQGYRRSQTFIDENRAMLENLVRELREGEITREKTLKVKDTIAKLDAAVTEERRAMEQEADLIEEIQVQVENVSIPNLKSGQVVFVGKLKRQGILLEQEKKGYWSVQFGSLKMSVKETDIQLAPESSQKSSVNISVEMVSDEDNLVLGQKDSRASFKTLADKPVFELRLLGMRFEEAMRSLERQLDLCVLNRIYNFSVIHGKGTGALQEGVHNMLKNYPAVDIYKFAPPEDGGTGKTYVTMKKN